MYVVFCVASCQMSPEFGDVGAVPVAMFIDARVVDDPATESNAVGDDTPTPTYPVESILNCSVTEKVFPTVSPVFVKNRCDPASCQYPAELVSVAVMFVLL